MQQRSGGTRNHQKFASIGAPIAFPFVFAYVAIPTPLAYVAIPTPFGAGIAK